MIKAMILRIDNYIVSKVSFSAHRHGRGVFVAREKASYIRKVGAPGKKIY